MVYNRFTFKVTLYSLLIALAAMVFIWSLNQPNLTIAKFTLGIIFILSIVNLIVYVNRDNIRITNILMAFKDLDTIPDEQKGETFKQLKASIDRIINSVKDANIEKEIEHQYFHYTLERINTAVISFESTEKITIFNHAAVMLLDLAKPNSIKDLLDKYPSLAPILHSENDSCTYKIDIQCRSRITKLLGQSSLVMLSGNQIRIVTLIDITNQLTDEEITSYNKLIRVINHEISNSISPIKSLLNTLTQFYNKDGKPISPSEITSIDIDNTLLALNAMQKRAQGLMQFVESYRKLIRIPQPVKQPISISELIHGVVILKQTDAKTKGIDITTSIHPENLIANADETLMNQVLINLVANAIEAINEGGKVNIAASVNKAGLIEISVEDNGSGIESEYLDKVFTPFFTTKKEGSGIGLNLSREIIRMHGGNLNIVSTSKLGTTVLIQLPS